MGEDSPVKEKVFKCSVCKTLKTDAWYKKTGEVEDVLCNFCCDSSGSCEPKEWIGLCVHCLISEAAYPVYSSGFKQFACCNCYVEVRRQARLLRNIKNKEKSSSSVEKQVVHEKKKTEQEPSADNRPIAEKSHSKSGKSLANKLTKLHGYGRYSPLKEPSKQSK